MEKTNSIKLIFSGVVAYLSSRLGILGPILLLLLAGMIIDYGTGMLAAKYQGVINSRKGMWGIVKKVLYGVIVAVAMMVDWTIINVASYIGITVPTVAFFGLLVAAWLIFNELISILENLVKMEVKLPGFLKNIVINFKVAVEKEGDNLVEKIDINKSDLPRRE